eukprot:CAMPEP_0115181772 /NCGR_PEP_ID=MMETSP0270-20121206/7602_1 /TAXON_ID=71861 /ORGANISM="Scrippsiella trochoidea, Strain CCMP3099" /LENGTH=54 /DNA_ID=CAMNT_0002594803 /DNA_START=160 /DNA_END=321 /DNA_ORIENTATION=-
MRAMKQRGAFAEDAGNADAPVAMQCGVGRWRVRGVAAAEAPGACIIRDCFCRRW